MGEKLKYIAFALMVILLAIPSLEGYFDMVPSRELQGDFTASSRPSFTLSSWFSMKYQNELEPYIEENIGFHNELIRLNNQLDFSLFGKPNAEGVVLGKEGQLFEADYIRAYLGRDFVGDDIIERKTRRLKFLQEHLKREFNTDLIVIFEPGKASIYPEYIPERFNISEKTISNYEAYVGKFNEYGVKYIDLNKYFKSIKDTLLYPAFTKNGIHWSIYSMTFAADSIIQYIENARDIKMPEARIIKWELSDTPQRTDNDVSKTLNLICEPGMETLAYPVYQFSQVPGHVKPMVLVIGDSFYWNIFNTRIPQNLFQNEAFWYFFNKVYPDYYLSPKYVKDLDLGSEVEKQDVVLLTVTERFQYKFDWGFIDELYQLYAPSSPLEPLYQYQNEVCGFDEWFNSTLRKARQNGQSPGMALYLEALYQFEKNDPFEYYVLFGIDHISRTIKESPDWLTFVDKQAKEQGITLEEGIYKNARYVLQKDHPDVYRKYSFIESKMDGMRADSNWFRQIEEKAKKYRISLEEMMLTDAYYLYELEYH
jgi:hypothetical protein